MSQVWQALNSLSKTVGNRGGVSDAMLRGADATIGLRKAEYDIERNRKADAMAQERFDAERPMLQEKKQRAERSMELVPINFKQIAPTDSAGMAHFNTPAKDGKSLYDITDQALPGSGWDKDLNRINKDGSIVKIPRWQLEEQYLPGAMALFTARMDPIKKLNDRLFEAEQALSQLSPDAPEYTAQKQKVDAIKSTMSDSNQLAPLYAKKAAMLQEFAAWGTANGAHKDFLKTLKDESEKAEANFQKYGTKMTPEQRQVFEAELAAKKAATAASMAHAGYYKAAAAKAGRAGKGKALTFAQRKQMGEAEVERFALEHGLETDPVTGKINTGNLSPEDAKKMQSAGKERGLDVFLDETTAEDTGNGLNPFDNKKVKKYSVRGVVPSREFGLQTGGDEEEDAGMSSAGVGNLDYSKAAAGINAQYADMPLPEIAAGLKSQNVGPEDAKKILREILALRTQKGATAGKSDPKPVERRKLTQEELDALDDEKKRKEIEFIKSIPKGLSSRIKAAAERDRNALATHMGR